MPTRDTYIGFRIPAPVARWLDRRATEDNRSRSGFLLNLILRERALEQRRLPRKPSRMKGESPSE